MPLLCIALKALSALNSMRSALLSALLSAAGQQHLAQQHALTSTLPWQLASALQAVRRPSLSSVDQPSPCSTSGRAVHHACQPWAHASTEAMPSTCAVQQQQQPHQLQHWRGYKSFRKPMKPLNTSASWKAFRSVFPDPSSPSDATTTALKHPPAPKAPMVDSCIPPIPAVPRPEPYRKVGVIRAQYALDLQPTFAVVEVGGTQFKVTRWEGIDLWFGAEVWGWGFQGTLTMEWDQCALTGAA